MFKRKMSIARGTKVLYMDEATYNYITELENTLGDMSIRLHKLQEERDTIEHMNLKPVISSICGYCDYCVMEPYRKIILGCGKDAVCEDFKNREREDR